MNTILLVDDDEYVINGLVRHIPWEEMGVRVIGTAADGAEGLRKYRELKPDFVITDVYMPAMDGFQLAEEIHALDPGVPIVILSGYDDLANARKAATSGVHHFLLKPPSLSEIEFVVREVLQQLGESQEREKLLASYKQQQPIVQRSMKDAFFRDLLTTRYRPEELPADRIAFMELPAEPTVQALTLSLIRSDLARREERDWQLMRFGAENIVRETLQEAGAGRDGRPSAEAVAYSDQEFVVVFLGDPEADMEAARTFVEKTSQAMLDNILQYMKLSALAGLGTVRRGYDRLIDAYLESRSAVETAEMNEWNRVYVYAPSGEAESGGNAAMEAVRLLHDAVFRRRWTQALELWQKLGAELSVSARETQQAGKTSHVLVDRVIREYIEKCYHKNLSLEQIAGELHVNRNYLSQLFKRVTGDPFVTYLNKFRIRKAIELIGTGQYLVYEISEKVGFQNATYFSQVFKSITGYSPSEYDR